MAGSEVLVTRHEDRLRELAGEIAAGGGRVETVAGNVTDPAIRAREVEAPGRSLGGLDILVNNAGVGRPGILRQDRSAAGPADYGTKLLLAGGNDPLGLAALKLGHRPIVVNVSSIFGHRGIPYKSEYAASKFAVHGFSESIRTELAGWASTCWW